MDEMMQFPNTVEEFMEQYKIVDTEQIYTNGAELVPIFRMKQWFISHPCEPPRWIPVKTRQMTSDERSEWEEMAGIKLEDEEAVLFDCPMPYDGQEVLVCSKYGHVSMDECVCDEYGCGLDVNGDWDCIIAWMPIPKPYKGGEEE